MTGLFNLRLGQRPEPPPGGAAAPPPAPVAAAPAPPLAIPTGPARILTAAEVVARYGDPGPYERADGRISVAWEVEILTTVPLPAPIKLNASLKSATHITCHRKVSGNLLAAFYTIFDAGRWGLLEDYGGCYSWRTNRNDPTVLSRHAWGIAVDLNVATNPNNSVGHMPRGVIEAFLAQGFFYGGNFKRTPDPMHLEYAGPA